MKPNYILIDTCPTCKEKLHFSKVQYKCTKYFESGIFTCLNCNTDYNLTGMLELKSDAFDSIGDLINIFEQQSKNENTRFFEIIMEDASIVILTKPEFIDTQD